MARRLVACLISILLLLFVYCAATLAQNDVPPPIPEEDIDMPPAPPAFDNADEELEPPMVEPAPETAPVQAPASVTQPDPVIAATQEATPELEASAINPVDASKNWSMFRRTPLHSGYINEQLEYPLKLVWKHVAKLTADEARGNIDNPSSPAVVDGIIYFCTARRLFAVNSDTGSLRWVYPATGSLNATVKSSPLVGKDLVYFGGGDGRLYAITKDTGKLAWSFTTKGIMNSSPIMAEDTIFVGSSDDNLYAIDPETGQLKWRGGFRTRDDIAGSPAVSNGLVYFLSNDMVLYAAYTATGRLKWNVRVGAASRSTTPVLAGNNIYIGIGNFLQCFQAQSGRLIWSAPMPSEITTIPAVTDKAIYFACRNKFYSLTLAGKLKWKTPVDLGAIANGVPTISGDTVIVGTTKGFIYALDKETGSVKWKYMVTPATIDAGRLKYAGIASSPVVSNGALYLLSDDGTLSAFSSKMPDNTAPYVSSVAPSRDYLMPGTPPVEIAAIIADPGSGLNSDSIEMLLDGEPVKHTFTPESGIVWYKTPKTQPIRPLADGRHTVTLTASDWAGNKLKESWSFTVDNSIRVAPDAKSNQQTTPGMPGMPGMGGMPGMPGMPGMGGMPGMPTMPGMMGGR